MYTNFQTKETNLNLWAQICQQMDFGVKIQKCKSGCRISILEILCVPIFRQDERIWIFGPKFPTNEFWGHSFKNLTLDLESASLRYSVHQFSDKTENFEYLDPNLPKNGFWGLNLKVWIRNQHLWDTMCTNFQTKQTTFTFWAQICPKMDFGVGISKI